MKLLIAYGTTEGHTRKIASQVADWIRERGHEVALIDTAALPGDLRVAEFDAYLLAGSVHMGKHQAQLVHFVKDNLSVLQDKPSAFVSASLSAVGGNDSLHKEAQHCIDTLLNETRWEPTMSTPVAGALLYTGYDWLKRMLMRAISKHEGGDTDTSQDYEYTDWVALRQFVDRFLARATATVSSHQSASP